ncbi:uncharacterized protein LOC120243349 isoform X3 [Hyaena hyaena]|uniref:uncharacterized protein LOC120243349 isoform X3 n=1 Tax=Hyaena hyaena TaxID=95912 RepID=UPI001920A390|nr:uncharacterized protein LOC120243349 isoform X3 [Hyaena hyaena]
MRLWELVTSACSGLSRNLCEGEPKVKLVFRFFRDFTDSLWLPDSSVSNRASLRLHCSGADPTSGNRPPQSHKPRRAAPSAPVSCCPHRKIHSHNLSQPFICLWRLREANGSIDHLTTVLSFRAQKRGGRHRPQERMGREALGIVPRATEEAALQQLKAPRRNSPLSSGPDPPPLQLPVCERRGCSGGWLRL